MMRLALYKGRGDWLDWLIRQWTGNQYSHCEIVSPTGMFMSSSPREGGVRAKFFKDGPNEADWDFIDLPMASYQDIIDKFWPEVGHLYDWKGIMGTQIFRLGIQSKYRWFCSELCAYLLGYENPAQYSPGTLADRVKRDLLISRATS